MLARVSGFAGGDCHAVARRAFGNVVDTGNGLPDQLFDRVHGFLIERSDDRDRGAGAPGAAGTADAMDVVVGMMRHVEIEDVAGGGNVEGAGGGGGGAP